MRQTSWNQEWLHTLKQAKSEGVRVRINVKGEAIEGNVFSIGLYTVLIESEKKLLCVETVQADRLQIIS